MRKPPHTTVRYHQLWARLYVPAEVRAALGRSLFLEKVGPIGMPYAEANAIASGMVAIWKRRIEHARSQPTGIDALIQAPDQTADNTLELLSYQQSVDLFGEHRPTNLLSVARRLLARLRSIEATAETENASAPDTNLPFLSYFDEWQAKTHLKGKTLDQAVSDIRQFNAAIPVSLEKLTGGAVQEWLETLLETASAATVRRKLSSLKSYWAWLKSHEYVSSENSPFSGRQIRDRRTKVEQALEKRQRFEPAEVTRLINAAANDPPLQNLIRLAAFTGARREGLASLKRDSVVKIDGVLSLRVQEKTLAGIREIPIHRKMAGLVSKLAKESKDGFLIPSEVNRYGQRGDSLGKRFTRLKANLGFGEHRTFHSLRHTVVYLFRKAECPTEIRNQILGHEDGNGGAGAGYGGHIDQKHKLEWLERAIRYPAA